MKNRLLKILAVIAGIATIPIWFPASIMYWIVTGKCSPIALVEEFLTWMDK